MEEYFKEKNLNYVLCNSKTNRHVKNVISKIYTLNTALLERYENKGVTRCIRAMVIGVPNTGKSTLINSLSRGKKTITGNRPG